jgi:hypothetical protein
LIRTRCTNSLFVKQISGNPNDPGSSCRALGEFGVH